MAQLQLRSGAITFGTLEPISVLDSVRGTETYDQIERWYNSAEEDSELESLVKRCGPLPAELEGWEHRDEVVNAYWGDRRHLRGGTVAPPPDFTSDDNRLLLAPRGPGLARQTSLGNMKPRPPKSQRKRASARGISPRGAQEPPAPSPRSRAEPPTPRSRGEPPTPRGRVQSPPEPEAPPELDSDEEAMEREKASRELLAKRPPNFPTTNFWLPPLARPLTTVTHKQPGDHQHGVILAEVDESKEKEEQVPATWSLSPTPMSRARKQRYTLHPEDHHHSAADEESIERQRRLSPFAAVHNRDYKKLKDVANKVRKKDWSEAFYKLEELIGMYPRVARLYTLRAMCFTKLGDFNRGLKDAKKALQLDPKEGKAHYWAGQCAVEVGRPKVAATHLDTALKFTPANYWYQRSFCDKIGSTRMNRHYHMKAPFVRVKPPPAVHGPKPRTPTPEPEPEPPPPEALTMPADWRHIDISDLVHEATLLRDAILGAIEDGDVDKNEITEITNMMKRAGHSKQTLKTVEDALGDGDLDEDDKRILLSITPPEPIDDWLKILHNTGTPEGEPDNSLEGNFGFIKTLFRYYALQGTVGMDDVEDMGQGQFKNFAKEIRVMDKKTLDAGTIDRMFIRANQDRSEGVDIFDRANQGKALKAQKGAKGDAPVDNQMGLKEFVAGMMRLCHAKFKRLPSLADRWAAFFNEHVKKYADIGDLTDEISQLLDWPETQAAIGANEELITQAFLNFCVSENERGPGNDAAAEMMNMTEFMTFLTEAGMLDKELTVREARGIFVQVNLDDDLYVQEDSANSSSELVRPCRNPPPFTPPHSGELSCEHVPVQDFHWMVLGRQVLDEFIECIVRVAFEKDPLKHLSDFKDGVPTVRTNRRPKFRSALVFCLLRDLTAVWIDPTPMDTVILWPDGARWYCFPKTAYAGPETDSAVSCARIRSCSKGSLTPWRSGWPRASRKSARCAATPSPSCCGVRFACLHRCLVRCALRG